MRRVRVCAGCNHRRNRSRYWSKEWAKGSGVSKCFFCVDNQVPVDKPNRRSGSARFKEYFLSSVLFDHLYIYAETDFRSVAIGVYGSGPHRGEYCVIKWFRSDAALAHTFFTLDIRAVDLALKVVEDFNQRILVGRSIKVIIPTTWTAAHDSGSPWAGQNVLCEPFIQGHEKFNSNTGWNLTSTVWGRIMQALSHFSYHRSRGKYVLCDLQGGTISENEAVIADPVILTPKRGYGVTDLGQSGIDTFFSRHVCSEYCRYDWDKPSNPIQRLQSGRRTTMHAWDRLQPRER